MRLRTMLTVLVTGCLALTIISARAAHTLPAELSDAAYWKMISEFSEPDKYYQPVLISNEVLYQALHKKSFSGGMDATKEMLRSLLDRSGRGGRPKFNKEFVLEVRRPPRLRALRKLREISWARSHPA